MVSTLDDVRALVRDKVEEGTNLEYKRELPNNTRLAEEICALANTIGGTIIIGVREENRVPQEIVWVRNRIVEEKIQNILNTAVSPNISNVGVFPFDNPDDSSQFVIVISVPKSLKGPHMVSNRYMKRAGSTCRPMENEEVRKSMLDGGLRATLCLEINVNLQLAKKALELIQGIYQIGDPAKRKQIAVTPFLTDAWKIVISSGLIPSMGEEVVTQLVESYRLIHEINSLVEWLRVANPPVVHSSVDTSSVPNGTYVPELLQQQITRLVGTLTNLQSIMTL